MSKKSPPVSSGGIIYMPILFNGKKVDDDYIEKYVSDYMPQTKTKTVAFSIINALPFHAWLLEGKKPQLGGERQEPAEVMTQIENTYGAKCFGEGTMRYYTSAKEKAIKGGSSYLEFAPNFITFHKQSIIFDASKNKSLFFFLLFHPANERMANKIGGVPMFRFVNPKEKAAKTVDDMDREIEALQAVKSLKDKNPKRLRMIYESLGNTDWEEYVHHKLDSQNWAAVLEPIYNACKSNPARILDMIGDATLDIDAAIMNAFSSGIIKHIGNKFIWGDQVMIEEDKKEICKVPRGRGNDARDWFLGWIKDEKQTLEEVMVELEKAKMMA